MKKLALVLVTLALVPNFASANSIDECIKGWKKSPFKVGAEPDKILKPGVKVLGIGSSNAGDNDVTKKPSLVLVKPAVNVLGKQKITLGNPNGWYCFDSNVSVLGKIEIEAHCKAAIASGKDGANVLGASDTQQGVTVLGSLRVVRFGCDDTTATKTN